MIKKDSIINLLWSMSRYNDIYYGLNTKTNCKPKHIVHSNTGKFDGNMYTLEHAQTANEVINLKINLKLKCTKWPVYKNYICKKIIYTKNLTIKYKQSKYGECSKDVRHNNELVFGIICGLNNSI